MANTITIEQLQTLLTQLGVQQNPAGTLYVPTQPLSGAPTSTVVQAINRTPKAPGTSTSSGATVPAPTISQKLVTTPTGYQFAFNQIVPIPYSTQVIACYEIYRGFVNIFASATVRQVIPANSNLIGPVTVQDSIDQSLGQNYFYWVIAVDSKGNTSVPVPAQTATVQTGAWLIPPQFAGANNLAENGNFEASTLLPIPGWIVKGSATLSYDTATPQSGTQSLVINATSVFSGAQASRVYSCKPGDCFQISGYILQSATANKGTIVLSFRNAAGTQIATIDTGVNNGGSGSWTFVLATGIAPANAVSAQLVCQTEAGGGAIVEFDNITCSRSLTSFELTPTSTSGTPISATGLCTQSGTSMTINIAASTWQFGSGQVSYNSGSVTPASYGIWYVYADDPGFGGGAVTYVATATGSTVNANNGRMYYGVITTVAGGGGVSAGGGTGGGGVGSKQKIGL